MRKSKGFTLIELLVVIAIIAILAAMIFPVFSRAKAAARKSSCTSKVKQIVMAHLLYAEDHDNRLYGVRCYNVPGSPIPLKIASGHGWTAAIQWYVRVGGGHAIWGQEWRGLLFRCPSMSVDDPLGWLQEEGFPHYGLNPWVRWQQGVSQGRFANPDKMYLVADASHWNPHFFCTGSIINRTPDTLAGFNFAGQPNQLKQRWATPNLDVTAVIATIAYANACRATTDPACAPMAPTIWNEITGTDRRPQHMNEEHTRHNGGSNIGFLDGHVKWLPAAKITRNRLMGDGYPGYDPNLP